MFKNKIPEVQFYWMGEGGSHKCGAMKDGPLGLPCSRQAAPSLLMAGCEGAVPVHFVVTGSAQSSLAWPHASWICPPHCLSGTPHALLPFPVVSSLLPLNTLLQHFLCLLFLWRSKWTQWNNSIFLNSIENSEHKDITELTQNKTERKWPKQFQWPIKLPSNAHIIDSPNPSE